jgi:hypothetical protein
VSEMIERVAKAIRRNKFMRTGRLSVLDPTLITEEELGEARAAIEAMREPTEAMAKAGDTAKAEAFGSYSTWQTMCDEALK